MPTVQHHQDHPVDHDPAHNGWTAVPRSLEKLLASRADPKPPRPLLVADLELPKSPLVEAVTAYARAHLPEPAFNHSMRVFYYGRAVTLQHFPQWTYSPETWLLASLLHDIGTTDEMIAASRLSFEYSGGFRALQLLREHGASQDQADSVAETIIRHQDVGETGNLSTLGAVIHFATLFDNAGKNPEIVHEDTIKSVVEAWPRLKWSNCFATVIRKETSVKPWSHTTTIDGFAEMVEGNKLMEPYE